MSAVPKRIVIAAGGTAGHVVPALAVANELRAEGVHVEFIGGERAEAQLIPAAGFPLHKISVRALSRTSPARALRALALAAFASWHARRLLRAIAPDAVMGGGGYVAAPAVLAALSLRVPVVLTEADSRLGLTNRLLAPFARRVCLSFPPQARARHRRRRARRYRVTGRPLYGPASDRAVARARFGLAPEETCVLVFGGSLGARSINLAALEALAGASFRVLHVSGSRDYEELAQRTPGGSYDLREYLQPQDFAAALAAADLVIARAGGSVFEIAAHGLPAILIPYPHAAGDHQSANARWMADAGAAVVIDDSELTAPRLAGEVAALLADRARLGAMSAAAGNLARPDAAASVARELLEAARA